MSRTPDILWSLGTQVWHFVGLPIFYLLFTASYKPLGVEQWLALSGTQFFFNLTMTFCIVLLSLTGTRLALYFLRNKLDRSWLTYLGWCVAEVVIAAAFMGIYVCLMGDAGYFSATAGCIGHLFPILVIPYAILTLALVAYGNGGQTREGESQMMRFHDSYKQLKLTIDSSSVLYIQAQENYVQIHYLDNGGVKQYQLRASMNSIAPVCTQAGIFRCHRSYYVNPRHIKALLKDAGGSITAELDMEGSSVPVSRKVCDALSALI